MSKIKIITIKKDLKLFFGLLNIAVILLLFKKFLYNKMLSDREEFLKFLIIFLIFSVVTFFFIIILILININFLFFIIFVTVAKAITRGAIFISNFLIIALNLLVLLIKIIIIFLPIMLIEDIIIIIKVFDFFIARYFIGLNFSDSVFMIFLE